MDTVLASYSQTLAVINEDHCIGCTLCIKACPFDAIIGAAKQLHTVVNAYCTGCKLCIAPCPVDCISMQANTELGKHEYLPPVFSSHTACTQCGECVPVCPSKLNPENLYSLISSKKSHQAESHNLKLCTLCRKCDEVCPSNIPLSETFSYAINVLQFKSNKKAFTKDCKQRMHDKEIRLRKKQNEQLSQLSANKENLAEKLQALKNVKPKNS